MRIQLNHGIKKTIIFINIFLAVIITFLLVFIGISAIVNSYADKSDPNSKIRTQSNDESNYKEQFVIAIDAGHGGNDPGTSGNGLVEKEITLDICNRLNQILINSGIKTFMLRTGDDYVDHIERIQIANNKKVLLYMSIHCDWLDDKSFSGIRTFYFPSESIKFGNTRGIDYANTIQDTLVKSLNAKSIGIVRDSGYSVLKRAEMPSIIVELGFLSNKNDASLMAKNDYRQKYAEALADGIKKTLKQKDNVTNIQIPTLQP